MTRAGISIVNSRFSILPILLFIACLVPFGQLAYKYYTITWAPIHRYITRFTGYWTLIFLLTCLAVTPLRRLTGWNKLIKFRRMLGLFVFFYALCTSRPTWCSTIFSIRRRSSKISSGRSHCRLYRLVMSRWRSPRLQR